MNTYPKQKETSTTPTYLVKVVSLGDKGDAIVACIIVLTVRNNLKKKKIAERQQQKHPKEQQIFENMKRSQNRRCIYLILQYNFILEERYKWKVSKRVDW